MVIPEKLHEHLGEWYHHIHYAILKNPGLYIFTGKSYGNWYIKYALNSIHVNGQNVVPRSIGSFLQMMLKFSRGSVDLIGKYQFTTQGDNKNNKHKDENNT